MNDLTKQLSQKIVKSQLTEQAREAAKAGLKDYFAVTYPVLRELIPDNTWHKIRQTYPAQDMADMALKLAYAGHALDYDDFHPDFRGHPSVVILPVLLALLQQKRVVSTNEFLDAYCIGLEVAGRLGLAISQQHYAKGFHSTASLGIIAATAAMTRLSRFSVEQTRNAIGLACTLASGLRAQFGTAIKPLHAGFVAQKTIEIYRLVCADIQGQQENVLQAFMKAYSDAPALDQQLLINNWGRPFRIIQPGLEFKPYASCAGTHTTIEVIKTLKKKELTTGKDLLTFLNEIEKIEFIFPPNADIAMPITRPKTKFEGRFSLEYVTAVSLLKEDLNPLDFIEQEIEQNIQDLMDKMIRCPDMNAEDDVVNPANRFNAVRIFLKDNLCLEGYLSRKEFVKQKIDLNIKLKQCLVGLAVSEISQIEQALRLNSTDDLYLIKDLLKNSCDA